MLRGKSSNVWLMFMCAFSTDLNAGSAETWTQSGAPVTNMFWRSIAAAADGSRVVAITTTPSYPYRGPLFVSVDSGQSWASNGIAPQDWAGGVASSADGTK